MTISNPHESKAILIDEVIYKGMVSRKDVLAIIQKRIDEADADYNYYFCRDADKQHEASIVSDKLTELKQQIEAL